MNRGPLPALALAAPLLMALPVLADGPPRVADAEAPQIVRGSGPSAHPRTEPAPEPRVVEARAGRFLWLFDPEQGEVVACRLEATAQVEEYRVRCVEGALPHRY